MIHEFLTAKTFNEGVGKSMLDVLIWIRQAADMAGRCTVRRAALRRGSSWQTLLLPLLLVAGCSKGPYSAEVTGIVTLDGKPVPTGKVMLHPATGGPLGYGEIGADGHYSVRTAGSSGLIPGEYIATVVSLTKEPWEGITAQQVEEIRLVPRCYSDPATSSQKLKIASGANQCDLALQSRKDK